MPDPGSVDDNWKSDSIKQINTVIHTLCQPLTILQCHLEMATLIATQEVYREAVETGLLECRRMVDAVQTMRETMQVALQKAEEMEGGI